MPPTCIAAAAEVLHADVIDVLVQDRDWVDAEFAAVLTASGIRDPLLVGVALRPPLREEPASGGLPATRPVRSASSVAVHPEARTRSPPDV